MQRLRLAASCLFVAAAGGLAPEAAAAPAPSATAAPPAPSSAQTQPSAATPTQGAPTPPLSSSSNATGVPPPSEVAEDLRADGAALVTPPHDGTVGSALQQELDRVLREAARDLGIDVGYQQSAGDAPVDEEQLLRNSSRQFAFGAELSREGDQFLLRLVLARPDRGVIEVGRTRVTEQTLEVGAIRLLQQLVGDPPKAHLEPEPKAVVRSQPKPHRSAGKAVLTAHGALVGGYLGFSLEHMAGAGDARLVFPLMTLGAGAGVGASLVVAEEWDISPAEAWYVWAAGTWSTVSGRLIAASTVNATDSGSYGYGLLGTAAGLSLGSVALNTGDVSSGGALLTHSGALFGAHFGALAQLMARGDTSIVPTLGLGVGMGAGLIVAGAVAPQIDSLSASRVLFIDVSGILGGLAGAALASPILVGEELSPAESRVWLGSIALGTVTGAVVGTLVTSGETDTPVFSWRPYFDVVSGTSGTSADAASVVGVAGTW